MNWSDPNPGVLNPEITSRLQVHAADIGSLVSSIMRERERQRQEALQAAQQVAQGVSDIMNRQRADKIASALMTQYQSDPMSQALSKSGAGPADQLQAYMQAKQVGLQQDKIKQALATEQARLEAEQARKAYWERTPGQRQGVPRNVPQGTNDPLSKALMPYGATKDDLDAFVQAGQPVQFRKKDGTMTTAVNEAGPDSTAIMTVGGKSLEMPHPQYQKIRNLYSETQGGAATDSGVPTVTSKEDFDALPSGATYKGSDGKFYRKP